MMRQSEFKKKFDPERGKFSRKHIYGEGIMDSVKSFLGKKKVKFAVPPPPKPKPVSGANKNAGDKIVKLLSGEKPKTQPRLPRKNTQQQINNEVLRILSGSGNKKLYNY